MSPKIVDVLLDINNLEKKNVEEHHNERDVVKNMEMLVGKRGHVSFQTCG
jgi:hypothetical protein